MSETHTRPPAPCTLLANITTTNGEVTSAHVFATMPIRFVFPGVTFDVPAGNTEIYDRAELQALWRYLEARSG